MPMSLGLDGMALDTLGRAGGSASPVDYFASDVSSWAFEQLATSPPAMYVSATDKTWQAWRVWNGYAQEVHAAVYDHATQSWSQSYMVGNVCMRDDAHGEPALFRDSDGYVWCFYGPHNQSMQYSRTKNPDDVSAWIPQNDIADLPGNYTYPHPTYIASQGKVYLFMRTYNSALNKFPLILRVGTISSGVISWAAEQTILDWASSRVYQGNHILVGTEIQFTATTADAPDTTRKDVFVFRYDTATGNLINWAGTTTILPASLPSSLANSQTNFRIVDQTTATREGFIPAWCYDTSGNAQIVYMDGPSGGPYNLLHAIAAPGGAWTTGTGVGSFSTAGTNNHRFDGYAIAPLASGAVRVLWPKASGNTFQRGSGTISYRDRNSAGTWTSEADWFVAPSGAVDAPAAVRDGLSSYRVAISGNDGTGSQNEPATANKAYAFSDTGLVQRIPASARQYTFAAEIFFARMTVAPSSARAALYDAFIRGLQSDGIFDLIDAVYFHKCHDRQAALLNVVRSGWDLAETDSANLSFVTDSYIAGNGTSSRLYCARALPSLQTNPNALTHGSILRYNQNSAHVWGVTANLGDAGTAFGFGDPTNFRVAIANINATQLLTRLNREAPTTAVTLSTNGGVGFAGTSRTTSGTALYNVNGTAGSAAQATTGLPTTGFGVGGQGNTSFSNRQMQASGFGGGLTAAQLELLRVRVNTFLTAF